MRRNKSQECHEQWAFRIVPGVWTCLLGLPQVVKKTLTVVRTSPEKPSRCANIFGPNMFLRSSHFTAFLAGFLALSSCHAQTDSIAASPDGQWWKGLFRPEGGTDMTPGDQSNSPASAGGGRGRLLACFGNFFFGFRFSIAKRKAPRRSMDMVPSGHPARLGFIGQGRPIAASGLEDPDLLWELAGCTSRARCFSQGPPSSRLPTHAHCAQLRRHGGQLPRHLGGTAGLKRWGNWAMEQSSGHPEPHRLAAT